jgi:CHAD domain-containing protein
MLDQYDDGYWAFAADALLERLDAVAQEADGVRRNLDIEFVHRMRVASRRLRSALAIFDACLTEGGLSGFKKPIRRITRELGAARDVDVQIEFLTDFLRKDHSQEHREGIDRLLLRLRQQRTQAQKSVAREIDRLENSDVWSEMQQPLQELATRAKLRGIKKDSRILRTQARTAVNKCIDAVLAMERFVQRPESSEEHHRMRIAAKKLRYTMEIFAPLYDGELKESLEPVKETQKRLGEIHDCDVWVQFLSDFLNQERERTIEFFGYDEPMKRIVPGIEFLRESRAKEREAAYRDFVTFWNQPRQRTVWDEIRSTIEAENARYEARVQKQVAAAKTEGARQTVQELKN